MTLANTTTTVPAEKSVGEIIAILAKHGASAIMMNYDGAGQVIGVSWKVRWGDGEIPFTLPANVDQVLKVLTRQHARGRFPTQAHARDVAWRILKDWTRAQMALVDTQMVSLPQVFLPYTRIGPQLTDTLYSYLSESGRLKALASGAKLEDGAWPPVASSVG